MNILKLLNDVKHIMKYIPDENSVHEDTKKDEIVEIVYKWKYKKSVSECNILQTFIKTMVGRNIKVFPEQEYDNVQAEYGKNINASEISNVHDELANVWNEHNPEHFPDTISGKYQNVFLQMMIEN